MSDETATVAVPANQEIPENGGNRLRTDGHLDPELLDGDPTTDPPTDPPTDSPDGHIGSGDPQPLADGPIGRGDPQPLMTGRKPLEGHIGSGTPAPRKEHSENGGHGKHRRPVTGHIGSGDPDPAPDPGPGDPGTGDPAPLAEGHIGSGTGPVGADTK